MKKHWSIAAVGSVLVVLQSALAWADVPAAPYPDDPNCTVDIQSKDATRCEACQAYQKNDPSCVKKYENTTFALRCGSGYSEIWCMPKAPPTDAGDDATPPVSDAATDAPANPQPQDSGADGSTTPASESSDDGCSLSHAGASGSGIAMIGLLGFALVAWLDRKRRQ